MDIKRQIYNAKYNLKYPWARFLRSILSRCNNKKSSYYKKGIKNFLNTASLKYIWFRDRAYLNKKPSIHRINSKGNYEINNCCFIEYLVHVKLKPRKTHCVRGHLFTNESSYISPIGKRGCRICRMIACNKYHKNKRKEKIYAYS